MCPQFLREADPIMEGERPETFVAPAYILELNYIQKYLIKLTAQSLDRTLLEFLRECASPV